MIDESKNIATEIIKAISITAITIAIIISTNKMILISLLNIVTPYYKTGKP